jgi:hypothetical protein
MLGLEALLAHSRNLAAQRKGSIMDEKEKADMADLRKLVGDMVEAYDCLNQSMRLDGTVTPSSPGGQLTAHLKDGTPVDRYAFAREVFDRAKELLKPDDPTPESFCLVLEEAVDAAIDQAISKSGLAVSVDSVRLVEVQTVGRGYSLEAKITLIEGRKARARS